MVALNPAIFVLGTGPGTGKTTVTDRLHARLDQAGLPVTCLYEIEVMSRREFAPFLKAFNNADDAMVPALQLAIDRYLNTVPEENILLTESLFPFLRWLILGNAGSANIDGYCDWLAERLSSRTPTIVRMECDREVAVARARAERGETWYRNWRDKPARYPIHADHPDWDAWDVQSATEDFLASLGWHGLRFDTGGVKPDDVTIAISEHLNIPLVPAMVHPEGLTAGTWQVTDNADARLQQIKIGKGQVNMMGAWLPLWQRSDGTFRIGRSNTRLMADGNALILDSARFGRLRLHLASS